MFLIKYLFGWVVCRFVNEDTARSILLSLLDYLELKAKVTPSLLDDQAVLVIRQLLLDERLVRLLTGWLKSGLCGRDTHP